MEIIWQYLARKFNVEFPFVKYLPFFENLYNFLLQVELFPQFEAINLSDTLMLFIVNVNVCLLLCHFVGPDLPDVFSEASSMNILYLAKTFAYLNTTF